MPAPARPSVASRSGVEGKFVQTGWSWLLVQARAQPYPLAMPTASPGGGTKVPQRLTLGYDFMPVIYEGLEDGAGWGRGRN